MNEQDVRALVREAIERHLGRPGEKMSPALPGHASHILLKVLPGSEVDDGMCVIEPAVRCNHCGFCQSYGH
jgi:hypothetical protein